MSVIRVKHNREYPYINLNKEAVLNPNLSLKAVGLWARCMAKPDKWKFVIKNMVKEMKEGRRAIDGAMQELIKENYILRLEHWEKSEDGKFKTGGVEYVVFEFPPTQKEKDDCIEEFKKFYRHCYFGNCRNGDRRNSNLLNKDIEQSMKEVKKDLPPLPPPKPKKSHTPETLEKMRRRRISSGWKEEEIEEAFQKLAEMPQKSIKNVEGWLDTTLHSIRARNEIKGHFEAKQKEGVERERQEKAKKAENDRKLEELEKIRKDKESVQTEKENREYVTKHSPSKWFVINPQAHGILLKGKFMDNYPISFYDDKLIHMVETHIKMHKNEDDGRC